MMRTILRCLCVLSAVMLLTHCASLAPKHGDGPPHDAASIDVSRIPNAKPVPLPLCKYGNPPTYEVFGKTYHVMKSSKGYRQKGIASWYGTQFQDHRTSCGEPYNLYAMTAASRVLPLPTFVQVTNLENGRQIIVKVNDRGPFADNRIMDLSYVAARKLGMIQKGTALVEVVAIDPTRATSSSFASVKARVIQAKKPHVYVQVATFSRRETANALMKKLKSQTHYPLFISETHSGLQYFYRVRIGPMPDVDTADALSSALEKAGFGKPLEIVN